MVLFSDGAAGVNYREERLAHKLIDAMVNAAQGSLKGGRVENSENIRLGEHHGREARFVSSDGSQIRLMRVYIVGKRTYQLTAGWSAKTDRNADAVKFLTSFALVEP